MAEAITDGIHHLPNSRLLGSATMEPPVLWMLKKIYFLISHITNKKVCTSLPSHDVQVFSQTPDSYYIILRGSTPKYSAVSTLAKTHTDL